MRFIFRTIVVIVSIVAIPLWVATGMVWGLEAFLKRFLELWRGI